MEKYIELIDEVSYNLLEKMIENGNLQNCQDIMTIIKETRNLLIKNKEANVEEIICIIMNSYVKKANEFIADGLTPGISTGIKIAGGPEINIYRGMTSIMENAKPIDEDVKFDLASISKMFTATHILKNVERNYFSLEQKISEINPSYKQDTNLIELLTFWNLIQTNGRIEDAANSEKAIELLQNAVVKEKGIHIYSDIPYMLAYQLVPNREKEFHTIFNKELEMNETTYEQKKGITYTGGLMEELHLVHDPKARKVEYAGHAGIYSTTHDLLKLFDKFSNKNRKDRFLQQSSINKLTYSLHKGDYVRNGDKSIRYIKNYKNGIYTSKTPMWINYGMMNRKMGLGLDKTEVMPLQSKHAFAISGYTGTYANYDIENGFSANILTNPFSGYGKPTGYVYTLDEIKVLAIKASIQLQIVMQVFDKYYEKSLAFQKRYRL